MRYLYLHLSVECFTCKCKPTLIMRGWFVLYVSNPGKSLLVIAVRNEDVEYIIKGKVRKWVHLGECSKLVVI